MNILGLMPSAPVNSPRSLKDLPQAISPQYELPWGGICYSLSFLSRFYFYLVTIDSSQFRDFPFPPSSKENKKKNARSYNQL